METKTHTYSHVRLVVAHLQMKRNAAMAAQRYDMARRLDGRIVRLLPMLESSAGSK